MRLLLAVLLLFVVLASCEKTLDRYEKKLNSIQRKFDRKDAMAHGKVKRFRCIEEYVFVDSFGNPIPDRVETISSSIVQYTNMNEGTNLQQFIQQQADQLTSQSLAKAMQPLNEIGVFSREKSHEAKYSAAPKIGPWENELLKTLDDDEEPTTPTPVKWTRRPIKTTKLDLTRTQPSTTRSTTAVPTTTSTTTTTTPPPATHLPLQEVTKKHRARVQGVRTRVTESNEIEKNPIRPQLRREKPKKKSSHYRTDSHSRESVTAQEDEQAYEIDRSVVSPRRHRRPHVPRADFEDDEEYERPIRRRRPYYARESGRRYAKKAFGDYEEYYDDYNDIEYQRPIRPFTKKYRDYGRGDPIGDRYVPIDEPLPSFRRRLQNRVGVPKADVEIVAPVQNVVIPNGVAQPQYQNQQIAQPPVPITSSLPIQPIRTSPRPQLNIHTLAPPPPPPPPPSTLPKVQPDVSKNSVSILEQATPANCHKMKMFAAAYGVEDITSFARGNCTFLQAFAPTATCEQIIHFITSCEKRRFFS